MIIQNKVKQKRRKSAEQNSRGIAPWLFLAPSLIGVLVMVLLPFADAVKRSFFSVFNGKFMGLQNYKSVLENQSFQLAAKNTVRFIVSCLPLLLVFSLVLAVALTAYKEKRGIFKTSFLLPMAIPVASVAFLWKVFFTDRGMINGILAKLGAEPINWLNSDMAFYVLVFTYLWKNMGYDMLLYLAGLSDISPSLYEAAEVDGAGAFQRFFRITLPGLRSTFFTVIVLSLLNSFKVFREAYLLAGNYPDKSIYMLQHLFNNWFTKLDIEKLCAAAVMLALSMIIFILIVQKLLVRKSDGI